LTAKEVGVVVCSMLDPAHLVANLDAVERPRFIGKDVIAALTAAAA
jgi:hypothetical protein